MNRRQVFRPALAGLVFAASVCGLAIAAEKGWHQYVCQKCDHRYPKQLRTKMDDGECYWTVNGKNCGGLIIDTPCSPPG